MEERWLPVVGFEELYEVSDLGRVRDLFGQFRVPGLHEYGYPMVSLYLRGKHIRRTVHTLVAEAFIGPRPGPERYDVHHKNDDPADPRLENLEYITHAENIRRGRRTGPPKGSRSPHPHKLTEELARAIKYDTRCIKVIAAEFGISTSLVKQIRYGKVWSWIA